MSRIRSVTSVAKALIDPSVLAGRIAAFATMLPSNEFRVETKGCAPPAGHRVKYPRPARGTTVALSANVWAPVGILQTFPFTGQLRVVPAPITGPPNVAAG